MTQSYDVLLFGTPCIVEYYWTTWSLELITQMYRLQFIQKILNRHYYERQTSTLKWAKVEIKLNSVKKLSFTQGPSMYLHTRFIEHSTTDTDTQRLHLTYSLVTELLNKMYKGRTTFWYRVEIELNPIFTCYISNWSL